MWQAMGVVVAVAASPQHRLEAVATTGMVADLVRQVGGDRVAVRVLMGAGVDPHLYKPTPADAAVLSRARVIFYNGLRLEGRMEELLQRLERSGRVVRAVTSDLPREMLLGTEDHPDPHVWMDVSLWERTVPVVVAGLAAVDEAGKKEYEARGADLQKRMRALHLWCQEEANALPSRQRVLVTSHDAFGYFGRAYGFRVLGLQGVSTVSEAALADVTALADFIRREGVRAIFVESSVNPAALRRVAQDAGVRIGGELFSDAMGAVGEIRRGVDVGTYEGMVRYNMLTIVEALR